MNPLRGGPRPRGRARATHVASLDGRGAIRPCVERLTARDVVAHGRGRRAHRLRRRLLGACPMPVPCGDAGLAAGAPVRRTVSSFLRELSLRDPFFATQSAAGVRRRWGHRAHSRGRLPRGDRPSPRSTQSTKDECRVCASRSRGLMRNATGWRNRHRRLGGSAIGARSFDRRRSVPALLSKLDKQGVAMSTNVGSDARGRCP